MCCFPSAWFSDSSAGNRDVSAVLRPGGGSLALVTLVNRTIETDESGNKVSVVAGLGFYLWLASMVALAAAR